MEKEISDGGPVHGIKPLTYNKEVKGKPGKRKGEPTREKKSGRPPTSNLKN